MAFISRPGKEGNATTYQGKVAAGYTNILAQELDADFDAIYSAWNAGVDTVNIKDQSVTAAKLAPGAVGASALAPGSITNAALAANSVQSINIVDGTIVGADIAAGAINDSKVSGLSFNVISGGTLTPGLLSLNPRGEINAGSAVDVDILANDPTTWAYDVTKPSYLLRLDYTGDAVEVWRSPPPGNAYVRVFQITSTGLPGGSVSRAALAVNAPNGNAVTVASPANFSLVTAGVWTTFVTLPALTTRGGFVHLHANHNLTVNAPSSGAVCSQRWLRDGTQLFSRPFNISCPAAQSIVPLPGISWVDTAAPPGTHTYIYQVLVGTGATMIAAGVADGWFMAVEVG